VTFTFDVGRIASVARKDTVEFHIADKKGGEWTKSIILTYNAPATFQLDQNFPNPFNPSTTIQYQLPVDSRVSLIIYDVLGREVMTLVEEQQVAGYHDKQFDASNVASGVYFYRIVAQPANGGSSYQQVRKLLVLR
jgi:glucuronoarabinoxylan endo-1,4-beta-xylanase